MKKITLKRLVVCSGVFLISLMLITALAAASTKNRLTVPNSVKDSSVCQTDVASLLALIINERARVGSPALTIDPALAASAHNKLADEVAGQYYGHNLLDGSSTGAFIRSQGVNAAWGEDLDVNALTPTIDWSSFKASAAHYASLTDPQYTRVGIAEQCVDLTIKASTGPDDNSNLIGVPVKELTVVHLAAPERD